ncbi:response regulator [Pedosphaera parvula]|uniref:Response regulator receiver protein n=1 Tax=Pedosphaera parvula (strain Ellin514) TaxID=320771 RepID=B9XKQ7_PEDPL|nr:response regulator [Pedosphaera parvula]EEF59550.1 response regulator receiver protein [Pedosphaera parvula Ellin514]
MLENSTILLVEDDENDVFFFKRAFLLSGLSNPLQVAENGENAIAYLSGAEAYADREKFPIPMLIVMDIKMPRINGFEVLEWLRNRPELKHIPVVMLSSSSTESDKERARELGAAAYVSKPMEAKELQRINRIIVEYWDLMSKQR